MTTEALAAILRQALIALGLLFVIVNIRSGWQLVTWLRRRRTAVIVWVGPKPPYFTVNLAIGVLLGILLLVNAWIAGRYRVSSGAPLMDALVSRGPEFFGLGMMFIYYGYLLPFSVRIQRGLYEDGIWTNSGFMRYVDMGGLTWKGDTTLVIASKRKTVAWPLTVPGDHLGEVRHFLRDKIASHAIAIDEGPGLHLGSRDTRESV